MHHIKELRASTNLSQSAFAEMFGIPLSTLRKWEQNESTPPAYVINFIEKSLPSFKEEYSIHKGKNGQIYYLDATNKKVGDAFGNWISFTEDINGVMEENIGIYIERLFVKYYQAIDEFNDDLKFDKIEKISWR